MRIVVTGKGGSGKTMIAGALSRHLARLGHRVVAVDADPNPNLGIALGVPRHAVESMPSILNALLDSGHTHADPTPPAEDMLTRYGIDAPDGVRLVATGRIERPTEACLCCGSHTTTRRFFADLSADDRIVVADLEAGLKDLLWARPKPEDLVLAITEGSAKSVEIARRACRLAREMGVQRTIGVANRSVGEADLHALAEASGVDVVAVPEDRAVEHADHLGLAAVDADPTSPAMVAVAALAAELSRRAREGYGAAG